MIVPAFAIATLSTSVFSDREDDFSERAHRAWLIGQPDQFVRELLPIERAEFMLALTESYRAATSLDELAPRLVVFTAFFPNLEMKEIPSFDDRELFVVKLRKQIDGQYKEIIEEIYDKVQDKGVQPVVLEDIEYELEERGADPVMDIGIWSHDRHRLLGARFKPIFVPKTESMRYEAEPFFIDKTPKKMRQWRKKILLSARKELQR